MNTRTIDIRELDVFKQIDSDEIFAVDTNVLFWMHSSFDVNARAYQSRYYPQFISDLISNENKLVTTIYNCMELIHLIEKRKLELYNTNNSNCMRLKQFRNCQEERANIKEECDVIFEQIKNLYDIKSFSVEVKHLEKFINQFENHTCDNFDYNTLTFYSNEDIKNIITDDQDFASFPGINIYTDNRNILAK